MKSLRPTTRVARGATYLFIQGFVTASLGLVFFIVLARALSDYPEEMGVYALLVFVLSLPTIFGVFALPSAAVKYISMYISENNIDKARSVVARILQIGFFSSVVVFVLLFIPAEWLSTLMFNTSNYALLLRILALTSIFNILYVVTQSFLQGLQRMSESAIIGLAQTTVQNSVGILLLYMGLRLPAVVFSWLAGLSIASIAGLMMTAKYLGIFGKAHQIKPLFQFSLPLYVAGGIGYFMGWIDQLLLVSYLSLLPGGTPEAHRRLGIYYVAVRASTVPGLFSTSIITALFPQLSELYTQQGPSSLKDAFRVSTRYSVLIGFPLIVALATLAYPMIILFAGWKYIEAAEPLIIISMAALVGTLIVAINPILMTLERTRIVSVLSVITVAVDFFLSYFALAYLKWDIIGTAWARTIALISGSVLSLYVLSRYVPVAFDKEALLKGSAASGIMVLAIIALDFVRKLFSSDSYQFLVIRLHLLPIYVVVGAVAYFLALIVLRAIKKQDIKLVEEYLPKKLKQIASWLERIAAPE